MKMTDVREKEKVQDLNISLCKAKRRKLVPEQNCSHCVGKLCCTVAPSPLTLRVVLDDVAVIMFYLYL